MARNKTRIGGGGGSKGTPKRGGRARAISQAAGIVGYPLSVAAKTARKANPAMISEYGAKTGEALAKRNSKVERAIGSMLRGRKRGK